MKPKTISENMMYNTVRLEAHSGSTGTGFFYNFKVDDIVYPAIVTNQHVVNYKQVEKIKFIFHLIKDEHNYDENILAEYITEWIFHPTKDLCICLINPIFEDIKRKTGKAPFYIVNDDSIVATQEKLNELSALEELVMVGYPIGLFDNRNNFPIFRKGYTASHPAHDFNEEGIGLADIACFPGSSGSPIFILNENGFTDRNGTHHIGQPRIILLGILYAGPCYDAKGNIKEVEIPTKQEIQTTIPIMTNLGSYIKATELKYFENYIRENNIK